MESLVQEYLHTLNSPKCWYEPFEAEKIIEKLQGCFKEDLNMSSANHIIGCVLDEKDALFTYIWKVYSNREAATPLSEVFKLFNYLVNNLKTQTEPYFELMFQKSCSLIDAEMGKVRQLSLQLIRNLISIDCSVTFDITMLVTKLKKYLEEEKKIQGNVSREIYKTLGVIFSKYPEHIKVHQAWLFNDVIECLKNEFSSKSPGSSRAQGAFHAVYGYLNNFSPKSDEISSIYDCIVSASESENRQLLPSALNIVHSHWTKFFKLFSRDQTFWRGKLSAWLKFDTKFSKCAYKTVNAFYQMIALALRQEFRGPEALSDYVTEFERILQTADSNHWEKKSALVGVKLFTLTNILQSDLDKVYHLIVDLTRQRNSDSNHLPLCIECVSAIVLKFYSDEKSPRICSLFVGINGPAWLQHLSVSAVERYSSLEDEELREEFAVSLEKSFYMLGLCGLQILSNHLDRVIYQGLIRNCSLASSGSHFRLWRHLLNLTKTPSSPLNGSIPLKEKVAARVLDGFVGSLIRMTSKLNYGLRGVDEAEMENPTDFRIFEGCVDLYEDAVAHVARDLMPKWLNKLFQTFVGLSRKHPRITGFYRLVKTTLEIADEVGFFEGSAGENERQLLTRFLQENLKRLDNRNGRVQKECLGMLFAAPAILVRAYVDDTRPAFRLALQLGRGCTPLLKDAVAALEKWSTVSTNLAESIRPDLEEFFRTVHQNSAGSGNDDDELIELQKKVFLFLGLGRNVFRESIDPFPTDAGLVYRMPNLGGPCEVYLDKILPRIIELALSCGDRVTRLSACELLYSIALIVLGNGNQCPGGFAKIFDAILRSAFRLSSDPDEVVRQIYEPLTRQMIRYFARKDSRYLAETGHVIDVLADSLAGRYGPGYRARGASLLAEFVAWSVKEERKCVPETTTRIINIIYGLCLHPSRDKRLGAAVAFNEIYAALGDDRHVLNAHWFQLYYYFFESLRMCGDSEDATGVIQALEHVKFQLVEKQEEFNEPSPSRMAPEEFGGAVLANLVRWTLTRCRDGNETCRKAAMAAVENLVPVLRGCPSLSALVSTHRPEENLRCSEMETIDFLKDCCGLFDYYRWLLDRRAVGHGIFRSGFDRIQNDFATGLFSTGGECHPAKRDAVLSYLKLISVPGIKIRDWRVVKFSVFKPHLMGFDVRDGETTGELFTALSELFRRRNLSPTDWDSFYEGAESLICTPVLTTISRNRHVDVTNREFLFAFCVAENAGTWREMAERLSYRLTGNLIARKIFACLFRGSDGLVAPDPDSRAYLERLFELASRVDAIFDDVFEFANDSRRARDGRESRFVKRGEHFLASLGEVVSRFFEDRNHVLVEKTLRDPSPGKLRFFFHVLRCETDAGRAKLSRTVIRRWDEFGTVFRMGEPETGDVLMLWAAAAAAESVGEPGCIRNTAVAESVYATASDSLERAELISKLLPYLSGFAETENDPLETFLKQILAYFRGGNRTRHRSILTEGMLRSLGFTGSLVILKLLLRLKFSEPDPVFSLSAFAKTSADHSTTALKLVYDAAFRGETFDGFIYEKFLCPLLDVLPSGVVLGVTTANLEHISRDLIGSLDDSSLVVSDVERKIGLANFVQRFIGKTSREELNGMSRDEGSLMDALTKGCFGYLRALESSRGSESERKLICEIFKMICSIVCARSTDPKIYKLLVFDRRASFLDLAVDDSIAYEFDMDFDEVPVRRGHVTYLRKSLTSPAPESVEYVQTDSLFTSSLSEDVTKFDFSHVSPRKVAVGAEGSPRRVRVHLESDSLNEHECMATLVGVVCKMVRDNITPAPGGETRRPELPCWLDFFLNTLMEPSSENLKLFTLKALYNLEPHVRPYAEAVFPVLVESIGRLFPRSGPNYFLMDLIEMAASWKCSGGVSWKTGQVLTEIVADLGKNGCHFRREVQMYNLEVFRLLIETWKENLVPEILWTVSDELLHLDESLSDDERDYYIQLTGILLSNEIQPWRESKQVPFFSVLAGAFSGTGYHRSAEVCGLALSFLERTGGKLAKKCWKIVTGKLTESGARELELVHGLHVHCPRLVTEYLYRIFISAWNTADSLTLQKLEMILSYYRSNRNGEADDGFDGFAARLLGDKLRSSDAGIQETGLKIARLLLEKRDAAGETWSEVVAGALALGTSRHGSIRKEVYQIASGCYRRLNADGELLIRCRATLIKGLTDRDANLREICFKFWHSVLRFDSPESGFLQIFRDLYSPETEREFLTCAVMILIRFCSDSGLVFPYPLTREGRFREQEIVLAGEGKKQENDQTADIANPMKKRFFRRGENAAGGETGSGEGQPETGLKIHGEYKLGDYPNIQVRHRQVLKPLEALAGRDGEIASRFLLSFFAGLVRPLAAKEREALVTATTGHLSRILGASVKFDPYLMSFAFQAMLEYADPGRLDSEAISSAATSSGCLAPGALLLEEIAAGTLSRCPEPEAKRRRGVEPGRERVWQSLGRVYCDMGETDVVSGIVRDKMATCESAREASRAEMVGDWKTACRGYREAIESDSAGGATEFHTESYLWCLARLSDWTGLEKCIRDTTEGSEGGPWTSHYLLSWRLRSEMMTSLESGRGGFVELVSGMCEDGEKREYLSRHFPEEMIVYDWLSGRLNKARRRLNAAFRDIITGAAARWNPNGREKAANRLQTLAELDEILRCLCERNGKAGLRSVSRFPGGDLLVDDVNLTLRCEFLRRFNGPGAESAQAKSNLVFVAAALDQGQTHLADKYLRRTRNMYWSNIDDRLRAELECSEFLTEIAGAGFESRRNPEIGLGIHADIWRRLLELADGSKGRGFQFALGKLVSEVLAILGSTRVSPDALFCFHDGAEDARALALALKKKGVEYFEAANDFSGDSNGYLALVKFLLREPFLEGHFEKLASCLMRAMAMGSEEARNLFGCLLSDRRPPPVSPDKVKRDSDAVPTRMFLTWTNQILASLGRPNLFGVLRPIVARVAREFPNALRHPLKLTREYYPLATDTRLRMFVDGLTDALAEPVHDGFHAAVQYLASPAAILNSRLDSILRDVTREDWDLEGTRKSVHGLLEFMFSPSGNAYRGPIFKFWMTFKQPLVEMSKLPRDRKSWVRHIEDVKQSVSGATYPPRKAFGVLESYSPWLSGFHSRNVRARLEIPGRSGSSIVVASFRPEVVALGSRTSPLRIAIVGEDGRERGYLVKFGEDLRLDERMQQVFGHLNSSLGKSGARELLNGYQVLPFTFDTGLVEWIEGTVSLREIMEKGLEGGGKRIEEVQRGYLKHLSGASGATNASEVQLRSYERLKREECIALFNITANEFPGDLLKKFFCHVSPTPERFICLRKNFVVSHSTMCLSHWVVGIGDRDLGNILVSPATGRVLGIDFGCSFGAATECRSPPELVPFRLTPQVLGLTGPLRESGYVKRTIFSCLRTYGKDGAEIASVLEVFLREPVIDWSGGRKHGKSDPVRSWRPGEKVSALLDKLSGWNPVAILLRDLKAGHSGSKCYDKYREVLVGSNVYNVRAQLPEKGLTEEEQVECLIDLATDPHVLGKTHVDWCPWL